MNHSKEGLKRTNVVSLVLALLVSATVLPVACSAAGESAEGASYSFVVFGDSRIPAYAPYDRNNKNELDQLVHAVTRFVHSDKEPPYKAFFNPNTLKLERIEIGGDTEGESRTISYGRDGWPDVFVERQGDVSRVSLLAEGQEWVYDNVVREVQEGASENDEGPGFVLHTGDIVYFGFQGKGAEESPYWRDFKRRFLSRLPDGGPGDLPARFFRLWETTKPGGTKILSASGRSSLI